MRQEDFDNKLKTGNRYERDFATCYVMRGYSVDFNNTNNHDVTISLAPKEKLYEVKSDQKSEHSCNWAFECAQGWDSHASGLAVTKSDYWVQYSHCTYHIWCTSVLQDYIFGTKENPKWGVYAQVTGGDNNNTMYLIPVEQMQKELPPLYKIPMRNTIIEKYEKICKNNENN